MKRSNGSVRSSKSDHASIIAVMRRLAFILFLALCAAWYIQQNILNVLPTPAPSDFRFYYYAAGKIVHGQSPYLIADYIYPPLLACLLTPIARFDYLTARWIWFIFSHACLLAAAYLLWRRVGRDLPAASVIAFVWSAGWVAQDSFATGQPDPLLVLLIVIAITSTALMQGVAIGAGFAVKLIPAVLGLLAPLNRNWRAFAATLASAAALFAIPWGIIAFLDGPKRPSNTDYLFGTPCVLSWSFPSVALRIIEPPSRDGQLPNDWINGWDLPRLRLSTEQKVVSLAVSVTTFGVGLAGLLFKTRGRIHTDEIPIVGAALIALALAASPIAWWHYQAMQYPGVALLLIHAVRHRRWRLLAISIAPILFLYPIPDAVLRFYYHQQEQWPNAPALMYIWTSVAPIASLSLFAVLLSRISRATIEA